MDHNVLYPSVYLLIKIMTEKIYSKNLGYYLIIFNILLQIILFRNYINGDIISALHPFFGDSREYVSTTEFWLKSNDFISTFKNGWRLPGYNTFMLLSYKLAAILNVDPLFLVRILQLLATSFIPFFCYKAVLNYSKSTNTALFAGFIIAIYYPFYYYTAEIGAESISLFLISILFYQVSIISVKVINIKYILCIALNIALLTYFKPNHVLFSIPIGILLINRKQFFSKQLFLSIKKPLILALFVIFLLFPWVLFVSLQNKTFIPLATTSGVDMVIGTGLPINPDNRDTTTLPYKFEMKYNLVADTIFLKDKKGFTNAQENKAFQTEAVAIWKSRPLITVKYGIIKIAHSMGLGFRGMKDYFSFVVLFSALAILLFSPAFRRKYKNLVIFDFILFLLFYLQCFIYFGDMRLRILMLDMPIVLTTALYIYDTYKRIFKNSIF